MRKLVFLVVLVALAVVSSSAGATCYNQQVWTQCPSGTILPADLPAATSGSQGACELGTGSGQCAYGAVPEDPSSSNQVCVSTVANSCSWQTFVGPGANQCMAGNTPVISTEVAGPGIGYGQTNTVTTTSTSTTTGTATHTTTSTNTATSTTTSCSGPSCTVVSTAPWIVQTASPQPGYFYVSAGTCANAASYTFTAGGIGANYAEISATGVFDAISTGGVCTVGISLDNATCGNVLPFTVCEGQTLNFFPAYGANTQNYSLTVSTGLLSAGSHTVYFWTAATSEDCNVAVNMTVTGMVTGVPDVPATGCGG